MRWSSGRILPMCVLDPVCGLEHSVISLISPVLSCRNYRHFYSLHGLPISRGSKAPNWTDYRSTAHLFRVGISYIWRCVTEFCAAVDESIRTDITYIKTFKKSLHPSDATTAMSQSQGKHCDNSLMITTTLRLPLPLITTTTTTIIKIIIIMMMMINNNSCCCCCCC